MKRQFDIFKRHPVAYPFACLCVLYVWLVVGVSFCVGGAGDLLKAASEDVGDILIFVFAEVPARLMRWFGLADTIKEILRD